MLKYSNLIYVNALRYPRLEVDTAILHLFRQRYDRLGLNLATTQKLIVPKVIVQRRTVIVVVRRTHATLPRDLVFLTRKRGQLETMKGNRDTEMIACVLNSITIAGDTKGPSWT